MTSWLVSLSWLYFMLLEDYILYSVHHQPRRCQGLQYILYIYISLGGND